MHALGQRKVERGNNANRTDNDQSVFKKSDQAHDARKCSAPTLLIAEKMTRPDAQQNLEMLDDLHPSARVAIGV
jgi:hypothetical protein